MAQAVGFFVEKERKMMKKIVSVCLMLVLFIGATVGVSAEVKEDYDAAVAWCKENVSAAWGSEWAVIGLSIGGKLGDGYRDRYVNSVAKTMQDKGGKLSARTYTEYSRTILGLTAAGANVEDVGGYNMLSYLSDFDLVKAQGLAGPVWALIALDSGDYEIPTAASGTQNSRDTMVNYLLEKEISGGGWAIMGSVADTDMTAGVLTALSNYTDNSDVKAAVDRGLQILSGLQHEDGTYSTFGDPNPESCVQVAVALLALGLDADDERFQKNGVTLYDAIMSFSLGDGSFEHVKGKEVNTLASAQSMLGLAAIRKDRNPYDLNHKKYTEPMEEVTTEATTEVTTVEVTTQEITTAEVTAEAITEPPVTTEAPVEPEVTTPAATEPVATTEASTAEAGTEAPETKPEQTEANTAVPTIGAQEEDDSMNPWPAVIVGVVLVLGGALILWRKKK